ncbi:hypothetical protein [Leptothrix ochracea]|uniref:hypothetical protein n=1 Tax=Leptothrix ochracea TaxID=735331 RepID=UPI0034E1985F
MSTEQPESDTPLLRVCIVDEPCDVEETSRPFGKRWGQQVITLLPEHWVALQAGKVVAVDVQEEYVVFLELGSGL